MARPKLNDQQQARVVELHDQGKQQQHIAAYFNVSTRTIYRILEAHGRITTRSHLTDQEQDTLALVRKADLSVPQLKQRLEQIPLTAETVRLALLQMTAEELGGYFMSILRDKIVDDLNQKTEAQAQSRAAARASNGEMAQEELYG